LPAEDLEFYYNEIDANGDADSPMSWTSAPLTENKSKLNMAVSVSSERLGHTSGRHRHRSALSTSLDNGGSTRYGKSLTLPTSMPKPITIPKTSQRYDIEWESVGFSVLSAKVSFSIVFSLKASAPQPTASPGFSEGFSTISSSFGSGISKKIREIKKCRKVYGMDNRDMWCTQCKWKKACTRFAIE
jgi:hypothetical protein